MIIMMDKCKIVCLIISVFIVASDYPLKTEAYRFYNISNTWTALAFENEMVQLECNSDTPLEYCRFRNQEKSLQIEVLVNDNTCGVNISATSATAGMWKCHLGRKGNEEVIVKETRIRIVNELAATQRKITSIEGKPLTLLCVTTNVMSISYCRFKPPGNGDPFSITPDDKLDKPLFGRYYFPKDKSFENGECGVTIIKPNSTDSGTWTCSTSFEVGQEYKDFITIIVKDYKTISELPKSYRMVGILFGTVIPIAVAIIVGIVVWGVYCGRQRIRPAGASTPAPAEMEMRQLR